MRWLIPLLLLSNGALAQEFLDETELRFPTPGPEEYTNQVDVADVDNDGDLDIFFANGKGYVVAVEPQQSRLYINDGTGKFSDETGSRIDLGPAYVRDADFGDFNGDGWVDLILAGAFGDPPRLLLNNGDGSFANATDSNLPKHDGSWGCAVTVGDVDLDGDLDLFFTNVGQALFKAPGGQDRLYINDGNGVFVDVTAKQLPKLLTRASLHAEFADIDNDGDLDILVGNREIPNTMLINNGNGFFSNESALMDKDGQFSQHVAAGLLDDDRWPDFLVLNGRDQLAEQILINGIDSGAGFVDLSAQLMPDSGGGEDSRFLFHDIDSDGDWDVLIAGVSPGQERVLLNNGKGALVPMIPSPFQGPADTTLDLAMGDFNGDGQPDIVTAQGESGQFRNRIYIKKFTGTSTPEIDLVHPKNDVTPYLGPFIVSARVRSSFLAEGSSHIETVMLNNLPMKWSGYNRYTGFVGEGLIKSPVTLLVQATDRDGKKGSSEKVTIAPRHPLDIFPDGLQNDDDLNLMRDHLIDKGGLGLSADINGDKEVNLQDAQLLASGLGGFPIISRLQHHAEYGLLVLGAGFKPGIKVAVNGNDSPVTSQGEFSLLCEHGPEFTAVIVTVGGTVSNTLEVLP